MPNNPRVVSKPSTYGFTSHDGALGNYYRYPAEQGHYMYPEQNRLSQKFELSAKKHGSH